MSKRELLDELSWHFEHPAAALEVLDEKDKAEISRRGFLTKELVAVITARLPIEGEA